MRRLIACVLLALMVSGTVTIVSCGRGKSGSTTTDTTAVSERITGDSTLAGSNSAQSGSAAQPADTAHGQTMDTGGGTRMPDTGSSADKTGTTGTTNPTGTREPGTTAATAGDKGIGPVTILSLGTIDQAMVTRGQQLYNSKCLGCHKLDAKGPGPALRNATKELTPEYIMNIMLNPAEMEQKTPRAKQLVQQTGKHMPAVKLTQDQARAILEYLRSVAAGG